LISFDAWRDFLENDKLPISTTQYGKMPTPVFHTIGLIGKFGDPNVAETLNQIATHLLRQLHLRVLLDESSARLIPENGLEVASRATIGEQCDLAIIMGGDGTMLNAARSLVDYEVPILGVNLGRLGFLADVSPSEIPHSLDQVLTGQFREARRSLLHAQVIHNNRVTSETDALNDVVIHKREVARSWSRPTASSKSFSTRRTPPRRKSPVTARSAWLLNRATGWSSARKTARCG